MDQIADSMGSEADGQRCGLKRFLIRLEQMWKGRLDWAEAKNGHEALSAQQHLPRTNVKHNLMNNNIDSEILSILLMISRFNAQAAIPTGLLYAAGAEVRGRWFTQSVQQWMQTKNAEVSDKQTMILTFEIFI